MLAGEGSAAVGGLFEDVVGDAAHRGVILGSVLLACLIVIFAEESVQNPVPTVLDGPMVADVGLESGGFLVLETGDVVVDSESKILETLLLPKPDTLRGRPQEHSGRNIVDGILYIIRTGGV
jgi:hypothetical protein